MPLASAPLPVHRIPSAMIVSRFGVVPDSASVACMGGFRALHFTRCSQAPWHVLIRGGGAQTLHLCRLHIRSMKSQRVSIRVRRTGSTEHPQPQKTDRASG